MRTPGVLIVSAPSGAGKTSLTHALVERRGDVGLTVSHTTRQQRSGEVDGEHYYFVDNAEFDRMIADDQFVEHALVYGNRYGTSISAIQAQLGQQRHAILEIDWQGAQKVREKFPDAQSVFVMPPGLDALRQRLRDRGQDSEQVIEQRMREAQNEMNHRHEYDHIIVNQDFDTALNALSSVVANLD